jgi:hypothetical protein
VDREAEQLGWEAHLRYGYPLPEQLQNPPVLEEYLQLYMKAFRHLSTCRQMGMGPGPIPWTAVVEYARIQAFDSVQTEALHYHVERLDGAYLSFCDRQIKRETKPTETKPPVKKQK